MDKISIPDILTLEETSAYLRLPVETVLNYESKENWQEFVKDSIEKALEEPQSA